MLSIKEGKSVQGETDSVTVVNKRSRMLKDDFFNMGSLTSLPRQNVDKIDKT